MLGLRAIELDEGDVLVGTAVTDGTQDIMLFSSEGKALRFPESASQGHGSYRREVCAGLRSARRRISLISLIVPRAESRQVLTVSENGYGKRTDVADEFPTKGRGN